MRKRGIMWSLVVLSLLASPAAVAVAAERDSGITDKVSSNFASHATLDTLGDSELNQKTAAFQASQRGEVPLFDSRGMLRSSHHEVAANTGPTDKLVSTVKVQAPVALIAARWSPRGPQPLVVMGRYLQAGTWSEWQTIGDEFDSTKDDKLNVTEPWILTNVAKAQIAVVVPRGAKLQPTVEVIDSQTRAEDHAYATVETGDTNAFVSAGVKPGIATGPDGGKEKPNKTNDAGKQVIPPDPARNAWTNVPATGRPATVYSRADWGANESWMGWRLRAGAVRGAVVHHTATGNNYSPGDVPAILRSIYRYHAISLKWGDIGYNVLVDNFGRAWQGRAGDFWSSNIVGGHAYGVNSTTFGISVLGNYMEYRPSDAAVDTVARVVAYKLRPTGLNPLNLRTNIRKDGHDFLAPVVSGHRDVGATACPGNAFYAFLPTLRQMVAHYVSEPGNPIVPPGLSQAQQNQASMGIPTLLAGPDRVGTSLSIARYAFPQGARTVYVANGVNTADALAGGSLTDGPIVLVLNKRDAQAAVAKYVKEAKATKVVALGGTGAVSDAVLNTVAAGVNTDRIGGRDRVETSALIARHAAETRPASAVFLAEMSRGVDALAAGSLTAGPVILVPTSGKLPAVVTQTIAAINPAKVVALGGPGAVSDAVLSQAAGERASERVFGADRYQTAREISKYQFPNGSAHVYLASGTNPVDAVAGGVLSDGPILLLPNALGNSLDGATSAEIVRLQARAATALGGPGAVSAEQMKQVFMTLDTIPAPAAPAGSK